jgi:hypothetical protein
MKNALMKIIGSLWPKGRRPAAPSPGLNLAVLEAHMKRMPHQVDIPVDHVFSGGIYLRSITIPAGTLVMGKRHRGATCNILMKGKLAVYTRSTSRRPSSRRPGSSPRRPMRKSSPTASRRRFSSTPSDG